MWYVLFIKIKFLIVLSLRVVYYEIISKVIIKHGYFGINNLYNKYTMNFYNITVESVN